MLDVHHLRRDFPILTKKIKGRPLIYFDNAATTQKPQKVIDALSFFYQNHNANIHRGIHALAEEATEDYENARKKVARFIGAKSEKEVIFVRNTTEALNLVAYTWGRLNIARGDEIMTTVMEHHSNFLPWRQLAFENGAVLKVLDVDEEGKLPEGHSLKNQVSRKTKLVALTQASNVLGTINPIREISSLIHNSNLKPLLVVDGAQAIPHLPIDTAELGADLYAFSAHKMFGPLGIGILWGKEEVLESLPPFLFGGGMIKSVTLENVGFADLPDRLEAGTPAVADAVGLGAAVDYLSEIGMAEIKSYEERLTGLLLAELKRIPEVKVFGPDNTGQRVPAVSFTVGGIHPHDVAQFLNDKYGVAVRAGQHCAGPLHERLGINATVRTSLAFYNTEEEVETFIKGIKELIGLFKS